MKSFTFSFLRVLGHSVIPGFVVMIIFISIFCLYFFFQMNIESEAVSGGSNYGTLDPTVLAHPFFAHAQRFQSGVTSALPVYVIDPKNPPAPTIVSVTSQEDGSSAKIQWNNNEAFADFTMHVLRKGNADTNPVEIGAVSADKGVFMDIKPLVNTSVMYLLEIETKDGVRSSQAPSEMFVVRDLIPPPPPSDVRIQRDGTVVVLYWHNPTVADFSHARIYRSEASGQLGTPIADTLTNETYRDQTVVVGKQYWYTVMAVDKNGNESEVELSPPLHHGYNPFLKEQTVPAPSELPARSGTAVTGNTM